MRNVTDLRTLHDQLNTVRTNIRSVVEAYRPTLDQDAALLRQAMREYQLSLLAQDLQEAA